MSYVRWKLSTWAAHNNNNRLFKWLRHVFFFICKKKRCFLLFSFRSMIFLYRKIIIYPVSICMRCSCVMDKSFTLTCARCGFSGDAVEIVRARLFAYRFSYYDILHQAHNHICGLKLTILWMIGCITCKCVPFVCCV